MLFGLKGAAIHHDDIAEATGSQYRLAGDSPDAEAIKLLARAHQTLIWSRARHTNRLRDALREYYPTTLESFDDLASRDALAILVKAPTPEQGARLSVAQIRAALRRAGRQRNLDARAAEDPSRVAHRATDRP